MSVRKTLYMETTSIEAERTAAEIRVELVKGGATKIMEEYAGGRVCGITFSIPVGGSDLPFRMPIREQAILLLLQGRRDKWSRSANLQRDADQARRVAWRQVYRWIQAQVALAQTGMVSMQGVFFPYLTNGQQTVYEAMASTGFKALPAPQSAEARGCAT